MTIGVIINIGIGVIIAAAVIIGAIAGFCKQFSKPLVGLVSLFGAIILVMLFYPLIFSTGIFNGFVSKACGWFKDDFYHLPTNTIEQFQEAISGNYLRVLSGSSDWVFAQMGNVLTDSGLDWTIGNFFGLAIVNTILKFVLWLILYLIIKYFLYGVKYLLTKIAQIIVFKSIDKIIGVVWALLLSYLVVVGIVLTAGEIIIVQFFPNLEPTVAEWIGSASLLRFAHNTNILGSMISNVLNIPLVTLP